MVIGYRIVLCNYFNGKRFLCIYLGASLAARCKFRFPAYYQFFTMFILVLITSIHLKEIWDDIYRKLWQKITILFSVLLTIVLIYIFFNDHLSTSLSIFTIYNSISMPGAIFINLLIIWLISVSAFVLIRFSNISVEKLLVTLVIVDMLATVNLCFKHSHFGIVNELK